MTILEAYKLYSGQEVEGYDDVVVENGLVSGLDSKGEYVEYLVTELEGNKVNFMSTADEHTLSIYNPNDPTWNKEFNA